MSKSNKSNVDINKIIFEDINDKYAWGKYCEFTAIVMKDNGYINVTKLCNNAMESTGSKKPFYNWIKNTNNKDILKEASDVTKIPESELLISITGGNLTIIRGTYAHPILLTHIAYWISPKFAIKVSIWIEEWKKFSQENEIKYYQALSQLDTYSHCEKEKKIQRRLNRKLKGEIEVETKFGFIDILTDNQLFEIKNYHDWKNGIGQLIAYSYFYPKHQKVLYIFDVEDNHVADIEDLCRINNIQLMIHQ